MDKDSLEGRLLELLSENARAPITALARELGVARATVQDRIARLERRGIIRGYTVKLAPDYSENLITAHVMIAADQRQIHSICRQLQAMPKVRSVFTVSGQYDLIAVVRARGTQELDGNIDAIGSLEGVSRTMSSIVLSTKVDR